MNRTAILIGTVLLLFSTTLVPAAAACPQDGGIGGETRCTAEDTANYAIVTAVGADKLCGQDRSGCGVDEERERVEHLKEKLIPFDMTPI